MAILAVDVANPIDILQNITIFSEYVFKSIQFILVASGAYFFIAGFFMLWSLSQSHANPRRQKFLPTPVQDTMGGAIGLLFLGSFAVLLGTSLLPIATGVSIFTGEAKIEVYSVGDTVSDLDETIITTTSRLFFSVLATLGLYSFWQGTTVIWQMFRGTAKKTLTSAVVFFVAGVLCFIPDVLSEMLGAVITVDILKLIGIER